MNDRKKNCIFVCVFAQIEYVNMLYLLLESIFLYGHLKDDTEILVYTTTAFKNIIRESELGKRANLKFETNDSYDDIGKACKARLDLFYLPSTANYEKILYLDTDIIVKGDLKVIFDIAQDDLLYVLEEGEITSDTDYWGKSLFGDEASLYEDKTAFSSGLMVFRNCEKIKWFFDKVRQDIALRPHPFLDQPHFVYNAFKFNLFNNKLLKSYAVINSADFRSDKIIHHFAGGPGIYGHKIRSMTNFLDNLKTKV